MQNFLLFFYSDVFHTMPLREALQDRPAEKQVLAQPSESESETPVEAMEYRRASLMLTLRALSSTLCASNTCMANMNEEYRVQQQRGLTPAPVIHLLAPEG